MSLYTGKELEREARLAFRAAACYACPQGARVGRVFEGWRLRVVSGDGCAVIGYGKCVNGHEFSGACAI